MLAKNFDSVFIGAWFALLLSLSCCASAEIGDFWAPTQENVPVFDGPDRSFAVRHYVNPSDIVRQKSNKKIRGFIKVELPQFNHATGYVFEGQLEFLGGMAAEKSVSGPSNTTAVNRGPGSSHATDRQAPQSSAIATSLIAVIVVSAVIVVGLLAYKRKIAISDLTANLAGRSALVVSAIKRKISSLNPGARNGKSSIPPDEEFLGAFVDSESIQGSNASAPTGSVPTPESQAVKESETGRQTAAEFASKHGKTEEIDAAGTRAGDRVGTVAEGGRNVDSASSVDSFDTSDDDYKIFEAVADELQAKKVDRALWTQALAVSEGDSNRQKAIYVKLRAAKLRKERLQSEG